MWLVLLLEGLGLAAVAGVFVFVLTNGAGPGGMPALFLAASTLAPSSTAAPATVSPTPTLAPPTATRGLPTATFTPLPTPTQTLTPTVTGHVTENGTGLRLREQPGTAGAILDSLSALAPLQLLGRTADSLWLQVITGNQVHGWVKAVWVATDADLNSLSVTGVATDAPVTSFNYLSGVTAHARQIFLAGQQLGNRPDVFSKVGDSNTDNPAFLFPFDLGGYNLGDYSDLQLTVGYFAGSFSRTSVAAVGGYSTSKVLDPSLAGAGCNGGETPLACEYRQNRPSAALILLGTGDQHTWQGFEARYRQIIEYTIDQGIVPVLMTKADDLETRDNTAPQGFINDTIRRLAQEYDVPLLDLRLAIDPLPNHGCNPDGFHYNTPPDGQSANFDAAHMLYGFNVRNLTALEALDSLRKYVLY
ncbi:MAG: SH3 domain-containing protein [Anaerolineales bacterium]